MQRHAQPYTAPNGGQLTQRRKNTQNLHTKTQEPTYNPVLNSTLKILPIKENVTLRTGF